MDKSAQNSTNSLVKLGEKIKENLRQVKQYVQIEHYVPDKKVHFYCKIRLKYGNEKQRIKGENSDQIIIYTITRREYRYISHSSCMPLANDMTQIIITINTSEFRLTTAVKIIEAIKLIKHL